jgi:glycosyltransferase involved in cell wall biosynthesis
MRIKRGIGICHYNRLEHLDEIIKAVKETAPVETRIVVCDDGTETPGVGGDLTRIIGRFGAAWVAADNEVLFIGGPNLGVAANKNRALWALQDCQFLCILEDDLKPIKKGWFETYEKAATLSGIHHFCRVQDKELPEEVPAFSAYMEQSGCTPIYGPSPRGDLTYVTGSVINRIGSFNPRFRGAGYAHGEWSNRVKRGGMINHPQHWVDIRQARDSFVQVGDTSGGRWEEDEDKIRKQLQRNSQVRKELEKEDYLFHPLVLE